MLDGLEKVELIKKPSLPVSVEPDFGDIFVLTQLG